MKPTIGRIVIAKGAVHNNGTDEHPAIITRVWSELDPAEGVVRINTTILPDNSTMPVLGASVQLFNDRAAAEAHLATSPGDRRVAFWPEHA